MTREMDVRTETLYILQDGKNIMYYTLPRAALRGAAYVDVVYLPIESSVTRR